MAGTLTIRSTYATTRNGLGAPVPEDTCFVGPGFDDIAPGTAITVRDGAGVIIATSQLGPLALVETAADTMEDMSQWDVETEPLRTDFPLVEYLKGYCQFPFTAEVPDVAFYSVEISDRGSVNYSKVDLEGASWVIELTL